MTSRRLSRVKSRDLRLLCGDAVEHVREHGELARHRRLDDQPLARVEHVVERLEAAGELGVGPAQLARLAGVDEEAVEIVEVVVAGRAVDRPPARQRARGRRESSRRRRTAADPAGRRTRARASMLQASRRQVLQHREVPGRIEQPVGVIDADRVHLAAGEQGASGAGGCASKTVGILDPQPGQRVDVEEAPVVDLVRRPCASRRDGTAASRAARAARRSSRPCRARR